MKNSFTLLVPVSAGAVLVAVLGLITSPLNASDEKSKPAQGKDGAPPDMEAMMKKMEELAAPGPEHKTLASLVGDWEAEARCFAPGAEAPTINKGTCKKTMILGGRFLQEELDAEMMGKPFRGMAITGYDKFNKKYVSNWIDEMGTGFFMSEGSADASGKVLTLNAKMDDPMTGEKQKPMRLVTRIVDQDNHTFEMHDLGMGEKSKVMEVTYTRKGSSAAGLSATGRDKR